MLLAQPATPDSFEPVDEADLARKIAALRLHTSQNQHGDPGSLLRLMAERTAERAREQGVRCSLAEAFARITLYEP